MWDITRLMSRNVTSDLHLGVRRPQRLMDFKDLKSFLFMLLSSSLLPHPAQLAPGRKHQQEENPQPVHNKQRIWASRLWGWFLMGDQIVREFKTFFQEEEKSLRTLAAKISLPMWSTQSDCGGDQQERISLTYFANVWDEIRWNSYWLPLPDDQPFIWSTTFFPLSWSMSVF